MLIAALTPWLLLRVIPITESAGHQGLHRSSVSGAVGSTPGAGTASMVARQAILTGAVSGGSASVLSAAHLGRAAVPSGSGGGGALAAAVVSPPKGINGHSRQEPGDGK